MAKKKSILKLEKIRDFIADNPEQLIIVANPANDQIISSYAGKYVMMQIQGENHVVLRVVSPDMFELSIDEFASMLIDLLKTDEKEGVQFIKAVGGSVKAIGEAIAEDNKEIYAKRS